MAYCATEIYRQEGSLFTLHAVTAAQALLDVIPYLDGKSAIEAVRTYWAWAVALYVYKECPVFPLIYLMNRSISWKRLIGMRFVNVAFYRITYMW
eukprot:TRINITY_DN3327_c0_g1_i1.p1 TRINITY_DN3327_c0_g1~~TRINITY_DN3327_c0_g1_i1.p1  ORF type:complete len:95 (+),score=8.66 TRINITY_DN3327_c0_g1_i1:152-436(+)